MREVNIHLICTECNRNKSRPLKRQVISTKLRSAWTKANLTQRQQWHQQKRQRSPQNSFLQTSKRTKSLSLLCTSNLVGSRDQMQETFPMCRKYRRTEKEPQALSRSRIRRRIWSLRDPSWSKSTTRATSAMRRRPYFFTIILIIMERRWLKYKHNQTLNKCLNSLS